MSLTEINAHIKYRDSSGDTTVFYPIVRADNIEGTLPITSGGTGASNTVAAYASLGAAPAVTYGTSDIIPGSTSNEPDGVMHFVYSTVNGVWDCVKTVFISMDGAWRFVCGEIKKYSISANLVNVTAASSNPTTILISGTATLTFTAKTGYTLPDTISVSGATSSWNKNTGELTLSNPTGDVTIAISGVKSGIYTIATRLVGVTGARSNPTEISENGTATLSFTAKTGYTLPDTISVSGATSSWNKNTGELTLSDPTGDIRIIISGVKTSSSGDSDNYRTSIKVNGTTVYNSDYQTGTSPLIRLTFTDTGFIAWIPDSDDDWTYAANKWVYTYTYSGSDTLNGFSHISGATTADYTSGIDYGSGGTANNTVIMLYTVTSATKVIPAGIYAVSTTPTVPTSSDSIVVSGNFQYSSSADGSNGTTVDQISVSKYSADESAWISYYIHGDSVWANAYIDNEWKSTDYNYLVVNTDLSSDENDEGEEFYDWFMQNYTLVTEAYSTTITVDGVTVYTSAAARVSPVYTIEVTDTGFYVKDEAGTTTLATYTYGGSGIFTGIKHAEDASIEIGGGTFEPGSSTECGGQAKDVFVELTAVSAAAVNFTVSIPTGGQYAFTTTSGTTWAEYISKTTFPINGATLRQDDTVIVLSANGGEYLVELVEPTDEIYDASDYQTSVITSESTHTISAGMYYANATQTAPSVSTSATINFTCDLNFTGSTEDVRTFSSIETALYNDGGFISTYLDTSGQYTWAYDDLEDEKWHSLSYQIITITSDATVSYDFYQWFTANYQEAVSNGPVTYAGYGYTPEPPTNGDLITKCSYTTDNGSTVGKLQLTTYSDGTAWLLCWDETNGVWTSMYVEGAWTSNATLVSTTSSGKILNPAFMDWITHNFAINPGE